MMKQRYLLKVFAFGLVSGVPLLAQNSNAALHYSVIYTSPSPTEAIAGPFTVGSGWVLYAVAPEAGPMLNGSVVALVPPTDGGQWTVTTLHDFTSKEGEFPYPGLVLGTDGSLYGSLFSNGPADSGAVFQLIPPATPGGAWTEKTIYAFSASTGGLPVGDLIAGPHGQLYGINAGDETGVHPTSIYQLTPPAKAGGAWTKTVLYGIGDGASVDGGLSFGPDGVLYCNTGNSVFGLALSGTGSSTIATEFPVYNLRADKLRSNAPVLALSSGVLILPTTGGTQWGQIVALTKPSTSGAQWNRTDLYTFHSTDGADPEGPLTPIGNGKLLGTTYGGGALGNGTVYVLSAPASAGGEWSVQVLHSFPPETADRGYAPMTGVVVNNGAIFGLTALNGNTVETVGFELSSATQ